jgi:nitrite reductase/ring-hydroxylating ferredoxin subunit
MSQVQSGKFVHAASTTEVTSGRMKKVDVNGTQVLVANVKGI